jgi:predicted branched-subunit amino acid permease
MITTGLAVAPILCQLRPTMNDRPSTFADGLTSAIPIALGYFPIAFAFGVAATGHGL